MDVSEERKICHPRSPRAEPTLCTKCAIPIPSLLCTLKESCSHFSERCKNIGRRLQQVQCVPGVGYLNRGSQAPHGVRAMRIDLHARYRLGRGSVTQVNKTGTLVVCGNCIQTRSHVLQFSHPITATEQRHLR
jgi:hypothetical protein